MFILLIVITTLVVSGVVGWKVCVCGGGGRVEGRIVYNMWLVVVEGDGVGVSGGEGREKGNLTWTFWKRSCWQLLE